MKDWSSVVISLLNTILCFDIKVCISNSHFSIHLEINCFRSQEFFFTRNTGIHNLKMVRRKHLFGFSRNTWHFNFFKFFKVLSFRFLSLVWAYLSNIFFLTMLNVLKHNNILHEILKRSLIDTRFPFVLNLFKLIHLSQFLFHF